MIENELNITSIKETLRDLPLGGILYFPVLPSTNDFALNYEAKDTQDLILVITNYQTNGRGRKDNKWISPDGSSLTFSLILALPEDMESNYGLYTAVGALAVINAIKNINNSIRPSIKWPNDILIQEKKVCGILVEASWVGEKIERIIIGIGINITKDAIPELDRLSYTATSLEVVHGQPVDRLALLHAILKEIIHLRSQIGTQEFLSNWEDNLAFRGDLVEVWDDDNLVQKGVLIGLAQDGALRLSGSNNNEVLVHFGEMHLRPSTNKSGGEESK
ncbi:MAG TPA: biotin--[acetyl-CoA-carboxylase] ligase [Anaerolineales bacterium]|nr:biotin--[acetyl-CoA-carboxylase] ligase [Anaerolineales bacterium]